MIKRLFNKIKILFLLNYYKLINKIAIKSPIYKQLYNRIEYNKLIYENLENIVNTIEDLPSLKILTILIEYGKLSTVNFRESEIYKYSQKEDLLLYSKTSSLQDIIKKFDKPEGKLIQVEELEKHLDKKADNGMIFIPCNIWMKDLLRVNNLLYIILKEKGRYKI